MTNSVHNPGLTMSHVRQWRHLVRQPTAAKQLLLRTRQVKYEPCFYLQATCAHGVVEVHTPWTNASCS